MDKKKQQTDEFDIVRRSQQTTHAVQVLVYITCYIQHKNMVNKRALSTQHVQTRPARISLKAILQVNQICQLPRPIFFRHWLQTCAEQTKTFCVLFSTIPQ